jgi:putative addiction module component (TIGR02574 family)
MDLSAALAQINTLSPDDRIRLVQAIWDSIPEEARTPDLTDEQKIELDRRLADLRANPQSGLTWEQIKARVKGGT